MRPSNAGEYSATRFFVYEGSKGVVGDLFVANGGRLPNAREVEIKLLTHVIETLQQSPGIHRVEAQLLAHEAGSVARPFLDQGFQRHPRLFMVLGLGNAIAEPTADACRKSKFGVGPRPTTSLQRR